MMSGQQHKNVTSSKKTDINLREIANKFILDTVAFMLRFWLHDTALSFDFF